MDASLAAVRKGPSHRGIGVDGRYCEERNRSPVLSHTHTDRRRWGSGETETKRARKGRKGPNGSEELGRTEPIETARQAS